MTRRPSGIRYPEPSPLGAAGTAGEGGVGAGGGPVDVADVVRARHRAEAAEWRALFRVFREEEARIAREDTGGLDRDAECMRIDAVDAACARWCVAVPVSVVSMRYRLRAAIQLFEHLPLVAEAFDEGDLSGHLVKQIVDRTYEVDPDLMPAVDAALRGELVEPIAGGARYSSNAIDSAVDEIVMFLDPDGVRKTRKAARRNLGVRVEPRAGGVARLTAILAGPAGAAVFAAVDRLARRLRALKVDDDEGRRLTLNHCRAVALLALTAGRGLLETTGLPAEAVRTISEELADAEPRSGESLVTVHATAEAVERPSDSLPVWISRLGLLPSSAVAGLLAKARKVPSRAGPADQVRPTDPLSWLTSPLTPSEHPAGSWTDPLADPSARVEALNRAARRALAGAVRDELPAYALKYRIPEWLKARVQQRDGCCRFPGCGVPAADCDVDHLEPFLHNDPINGGWTIELNLGCLCRSHHRLKTHDRWTITTDLEGVFTFTSPDGDVAYTYPAGPAGRIGLAERVYGPDDAVAEDPPAGERGWAEPDWAECGWAERGWAEPDWAKPDWAECDWDECDGDAEPPQDLVDAWFREAIAAEARFAWLSGAGDHSTR